MARVMMEELGTSSFRVPARPDSVSIAHNILIRIVVFPAGLGCVSVSCAGLGLMTLCACRWDRPGPRGRWLVEGAQESAATIDRQR